MKRYESEEVGVEEGSRHLCIVLIPRNPACSPIVLDGDDEGRVAVVAELLEV